METLDLLGHHKNTFAGHFAPDDHKRHRHGAQFDGGKQEREEGELLWNDGDDDERLRGANLAASNAHNSRDRLADASSSAPPVEEDAFTRSVESQAYKAANNNGAECALIESNEMQYSSEQTSEQPHTNQDDSYILAGDCGEPLSDEDAFIAFCADSSSVLNKDLKRRYHINKLYQPLFDACGPKAQPDEGDVDDEFLLYQELKGLCEPGERCELSKMLEEEEEEAECAKAEDENSLVAGQRLAAGCTDLMGRDSLELTSIIDSLEAFESGGPEAPTLLLQQFHCSPRPSPDQPDSSGRDNERSPLTDYEAKTTPDCYSTRGRTMSMELEACARQQSDELNGAGLYCSSQSESQAAMLVQLDTPSSRPSTCDQTGAFQDSRSETSSVMQTTGSSTPDAKTAAKGRAARVRSGHANHYRRRTANARERIRMREINQAFEKLKKVVPIELVREASEAEAAASAARVAQEQQGSGKRLARASNSQASDSSPKLTKITTLRLAVSYISKLSSLLNDNPEACAAVSGARAVAESRTGANISKVTNSRVAKQEAGAKTKRRSRASKTTSSSDSENKAKKGTSRSRKKAQTEAPLAAVEADELQKVATPPSIAAFNDANGFKRLDQDDEKPLRQFENVTELKAQRPLLLTEAPIFNRTLASQQPQTAYIAIPHHQNQKQQYLTTYQATSSQQQQQQHSMISQTHFNQSQERLLVAPMPVAILVSNLVYINPMRQGVRQQQQQFCVVNQQTGAAGSQQLQNGSSQAQIVAAKQVAAAQSVSADEMNNEANNEAGLESGQLMAPTQPSFCQTKFVASTQQQCQQQQLQQQTRPRELLESNINKLVASLASSPSSNTSESLANQKHLAANHSLPSQQQQQQQQLQQQPVRTYRFHNYDGNIRL